ncbi:MAG: membrane protein insertion efficiency factor YidD [Actinomycetota bacterium]|nr:membrane protein insertion efficiency factor YidD [Actinomycetota bacterium]MDA2954669.1 membrane protein insertion efficiency factor YidD [Actinomycetota bacterium]
MSKSMLRAINWYQQAFAYRLSPCRFYPSCSNYAQEAITIHGSWRGGLLTLRRLLRCRPFGPSGFDPVPEISCCDQHVATTKVVYENV